MDDPISNNDGMFRSLKNFNARIFFFFFFVSHTVTFIHHTATSYLLYEISQNATTLGINTAILFLPMLVFGAWAGALADQINRRITTIVTQLLMSIQALVLGVLVLTDHINVPLVFLMSGFLGLLNAIDNPARRGLVTELVPKENLSNAIALNTAVMFTARVFGPALGAMLIIPLGVGVIFLVNGFSFLAILIGLLRLRKNEMHTPEPRAKGGTPVRDGLRFVQSNKSLLNVMVVFTIVSTFAFNYAVALPKLADFAWGDQKLFGWVLAVMSVGSIFGALFTARLKASSYQWFAWNVLLVGIGNIGIAWSPNVWSAYFWAIPLGFGGSAILAGCNAIMQNESPTDMRSRLLSLTAISALGSTPIGGPITGWIADTISVQWSLGYGGLISVMSGIYMIMWIRRSGVDRK